MKNVKLNLAVLSVLGMISTQAAAGFVTLPTSGTSAYTTCRTASNFGAQSDSSVPPTTDSLCAAPNGIGTTLLFTAVPETGFAVFAAGTVTSSISYFSDPVATLNERVWRNSTTGECIYGKQVLMSNSSTTDYNPQASGTQKLEVNDFAFGGYTGTVSVAYAKQATNFGSVYRAGRTFTSVQMQPNVIGGASVATGFKPLPTTSATLGTEITGVGQTAGPTGTPSGPAPGTVVPTAGQQDAPFSTTHNWVDFTTDVTAGVDEDGSTNPSSPNMYIKQACATGATTATSGNFKIRQTGQETQPWIIVTGTSRAPGTSTAP
ncbi:MULTISPECIES: hypothetical protein [unclassified Methylophilus]|uniref:hypothetical protein n=1 Tax=unclassified Methylophilus TaxID=2630143 RepID=UPI0006F6E0B3|nr:MULTISPECIES: hypothetical protein [unclassified Methylophilus]KQT42222.1 hypothetical protein ASG34_05535 [Methylophilus sp. Leaf416]KQT56403.1 hypothetical protein ASG44_05510 [Methylophilus sp. Leaf459]